jgi:hypothetical protein
MKMLPDIKYVSNNRPNLSALPPEIAGRVEDMWRVGGILSGFAWRTLDLKHARQSRNDFDGALRQHLATGQNIDHPALSEAHKARDQYQYKEYDEAKVNAPIEVNNWISTTHEICNRLASEAKVVFFQMAIEKLPSKIEVLRNHPLLDCLRRLRNVVAHHKPLSLSKAEFKGSFVDPSNPSAPGVKFRQTDAWYLVVTPEDLDLSDHGRRPLPPETAAWFMRQCDRWPLSNLLSTAVEELCAVFAPPVAVQRSP